MTRSNSKMERVQCRIDWDCDLTARVITIGRLVFATKEQAGDDAEGEEAEQESLGKRKHKGKSQVPCLALQVVFPNSNCSVFCMHSGIGTESIRL